MANLSSYLFKSHRPTGSKDAIGSADTEPTSATSTAGKFESQGSPRCTGPDKKKKEKKSSTRSPSPDVKARSSSRGRGNSPEKKKKSSSSSSSSPRRSPSPDKKSKHKRSSTKTKETTTASTDAPTAAQSPTEEATNERHQNSSSSPPNIHKLVNRERIKRQIPPLGRSRAMDRMAQQAVDRMAKRDDVAAGLKLTSCQRLAKSLNTSVAARNVEALESGGGSYDETESIKQIHKLTMERGSTSRDKILNERFEATGMAIATSRKTGNLYLVQIFRGKLKRAAVV